MLCKCKSKLSQEIEDMNKGKSREKDQAEKVCTREKEILCKMFRSSPVSLWEEDFSEIKLHFDDLKSKGITDLKSHFRKHPEEVISLAGRVKIISVNAATLRMYQAESEEELCENLHFVFNKQSYDRFREELIALSQGKTEYETEAVTRTLKGEIKYIFLKLAVVPGFEDTLARVLLNIIDVTSIRKKLEDLIESEEKYRSVFEMNNDGILVIDIESGIILDSNRKAEMLIGLSLEDIVGKHFTELCPEDEIHYYMELHEGIKQRKQASKDSVVCHESGNKIPVEITGRAIEQSTGRMVSAWFFREKTKGEDGKKYSAQDIQMGNLTGREREIFTLIANGFKSKQIANRLYISEKTVQTHRTNIMAKLSIHKESDLVRYAIPLGIINPESSEQP